MTATMRQTEIQIDGAMGEGGGQILRSSLTLSLLTGRAFCITGIRAGRKKPGLLRQHLTCVNAAATIGGATVDGAELGSTQLRFQPGTLRAGDYRFQVGTAGSTMLVLQTVLLPLLLGPAAGEVTNLELHGGTHNDGAPPFDFIVSAFLPLLARMGAQVDANLLRAGFYPAGGGLTQFRIPAIATLQPLHLGARASLVAVKAIAVLAGLPKQIGDREIAQISTQLGLHADDGEFRFHQNSLSQGTLAMVAVNATEERGAELTELFCSFGERGLPAEAVGKAAADMAAAFLATNASVGPHLADQLLLPIALAGQGSLLTTELTPHALSNMAVIGQFLPVEFQQTNLPGQGTLLTVKSVSPPSAG